MLRCLLVGKYEENWPSILLEVELAYNCLKQTATTYSPFEVVYGFKPPTGFSMITDGQNADAEVFARNR
jgi:hypothetical protein